ncbi:DNA mismatch repair endonuclease MutL [Alteromonas sp. CYL-A6]|uniref:DNA mismatch repair endonuclease MutL n=1 Tax=Alteromonas nitratireducens TaxID=3390813 RepID=UPI0034B1FA8D
MAIKLLEPQLANQIAAGEVVERPASVVKELIENSIDAGATRIELQIEKGGHKRIRITDNGGGIPHDELQLALSRHATSKISSLDDLENILSLGFRGEALASISSVSRLTLTSKPPVQEQAWQAHCEGRDMAVKINPVAHPDGTTIDVADLFYNTPARRKFLRTEKTEFQHIEEVVKRIALSHPDITFLLSHNGKPVKRYLVRKDGSREERIAAVAGNRFISNAIYTQVSYDGIELEAWLGNEQVLRSSADCQFSFVNGRGMRDKLILHAMRQAYESVWGVLEQPAFVVYLTVPPRDVDVNVHPAKHEVRFQQSRLVHDFIVKAVADALSGDTADAPAAPAPPAHDYIRPLSPAGTPSPSRPAVSGATTSGAGGSLRHTGWQGRASPAAAAHAAAQYQTLMSAPDTEQRQVASPQPVTLSMTHRMYLNGDSACLVSVSDIAYDWMRSHLMQTTTSQPLLMPVTVAGSAPEQDVISAFEQAHIGVSVVAGKVRLQQVPAGTRHWPWTSWLGVLLARAPDNVDALVGALCEGALDWPASLLQDVWHWFDRDGEAQAWERAQESGKVRPVDALIRFFDH